MDSGGGGLTRRYSEYARIVVLAFAVPAVVVYLGCWALAIASGGADAFSISLPSPGVGVRAWAGGTVGFLGSAACAVLLRPKSRSGGSSGDFEVKGGVSVWVGPGGDEPDGDLRPATQEVGADGPVYGPVGCGGAVAWTDGGG